MLQERCFQRVGSNKTIYSDVRIIAATHRNLEQQIADGKFREDLYYRLNVFPIEMPALRERIEDLPLLMYSMIKRLDLERGVFTVSAEALQQLQRCPWPGNTRELSNLVERLRVLHRDEEVQYQDLPDNYRQQHSKRPRANQSSQDTDKASSIQYIAQDARSVETLELAHRLADIEAPVLIHGESGTGKEVLARYIHQHSARAQQAFIVINCAMLAEQELDKILFGEEITLPDGTVKVHKGKFEQAEGGTVLLDEVLNMSTNLQTKILRLMQSSELERVGGKKPHDIDIRVIATTHGDIQQAITEKTFREDLYYRLNVFSVSITPLRDRPDDILKIANWYLQQMPTHNSQARYLTKDAESALLQHQWPGNVRELSNVIQRIATLTEQSTICHEAIQFDPGQPHNPSPETVNDRSLNNGLRSHEQEMIIDALRAGNGSRKFAAEKLGISPRTLRYKLARMREDGVQLPSV